jgi:hypothetical protein
MLRSEMFFDTSEIASRLREIVELVKCGMTGPAGVVDRYYLESREMSMIFSYALKKEVDEQRQPRSYVEVPLQEKLADLEGIVSMTGALAEILTVAIERDDGSERIAVSVNGKERTFDTQEAPCFAKEILRRKISPLTETNGRRTVRCPMCASVVEPKEGLLWGLWCPTCNVRLVLD